MNRTSLCSALGAFVALALVSGCGGGGGNQNGPVTSTLRQFQSLQFTLSATKATYAVGEPVPIVFTATNVGTQPINVSETSQVADVQASQNGQIVWDGGALGSTNNGNTFVLAPGQAVPMSFTWQQTNGTTGNQVPAGKYTITGWFEPNGLNGTVVLPNDAKSTLYANAIQIAIQ